MLAIQNKVFIISTLIVKPADFDSEQDDTKVAVIETIPQNFISAQKRILTSPEKARDTFGDNQQSKHACDQCGQGFSVEWYLRKHIESKHEGNGYQCENCKYKAQTKTHVTLHSEAIHKGVRCNCEKCDFKATQRNDLKRHVKKCIHRGIGFKCSKCEYKSKRRDAVRQHEEEKHDGIRYGCNQYSYKAT